MTGPNPGFPRDAQGAPRDADWAAPAELNDRIDLAGLLPDNLADLAAQETRPVVIPATDGAPVAAEVNDPAAESDQAAEQAPPTIWEQMGGPMGMIDSGLPVVVFIVANTIGGLGWGIGAALAAALVIAVLRLVRKRPVTQAIAGLFGVGIAAFIAYKTDSAKGYFLLGIWSYLLYGGALLVSILVRWPLIGVIWEGVNGKGTAWRSDRKLVRRYDYATFVWVLVFAARYLVQNYLYDTDQVGWLAAVRLLMGYPVFILAIAISVWIVAGGSAIRLPDARTRRGGPGRRRTPTRAEPERSLAQRVPDLVLDLGRGDEQQFVTRLQRLVRLRHDDPPAAQDRHQRRIPRQPQVADRPAGDAGGRGQGDLDEVDLTLTQGEQPDQVADRHGLFDQGGQDARSGHGDVHAPGVGEQPLVAGVVDPADDPADRELCLGQQRHHQVDLVVAGTGDHHVTGLQAGVLEQRDLAGVRQYPFGRLDPPGLDRLRVAIDQHHLVAIFDKLTGD